MEHQPLDPRLETIVQTVSALAEDCRGDCHALLALLRSLEQSHRTIQEELFQAALPNTRHELYNLLREIEENGGWPYIPRLKIQALTRDWPAETPTDSPQEPPNPPAKGEKLNLNPTPNPSPPDLPPA